MPLPLWAMIAMAGAAKATADADKSSKDALGRHQATRPHLQDVKLDKPQGDQSQATFFNPTQGQNPSPSQGYYDLMLGLSDLGAKEKTLKQQMGLAEELRTTEMPGMRSYGRVQTAAHPLEFLNSGLRQGLGWQQTHKGMKGQEDLAQEIRRRIQEERARRQSSQGTQPGMVVPQFLET